MGFPFNQYPYLNVNDLNLDWIIKHFKEFLDSIASLEGWRINHEREYEELSRYVDDLRNGNLTPEMYQAIRDWCNENIIDIVGELVKFITVSLNDSGYIVFNIPSRWNVLVFNTTGLDINTPLQPEYGHLTLSY